MPPHIRHPESKIKQLGKGPVKHMNIILVLPTLLYSFYSYTCFTCEIHLITVDRPLVLCQYELLSNCVNPQSQGILCETDAPKHGTTRQQTGTLSGSDCPAPHKVTWKGTEDTRPVWFQIGPPEYGGNSEDFNFSVDKAKEPQLEYHKTYLINQTGMQGNKPTGKSSEV